MQTPILTSLEQVSALAEELAKETSIAVDLEADSLHNYQEKVCLIQVSTPEKTVLIDPLAVEDLSPLAPVLADAKIRKIFHAADYDLRSLRRDFNLEINGLFDTMICAQFLGEARIGLADLLRKNFSIDLDKKYQKADWSLRPLPAEMVAYAAADTRYLHQLVEILEKKLEQLDRISWVEEECRILEKVRFDESGGPICLRLKGAGTLDRRELGILEQLMQWREKEGRRRNHPVYKVIGNKPLLALALRAPRSPGNLRGIEGLSPRLIERFGGVLLQAVKTGLALPESELPKFERRRRPEKDPAAEARMKRLKLWRQEKAAKLGLDPGVLINNTMLEILSRETPQSLAECSELEGMKQWQCREFGDELLPYLNLNP
ncbi:MAG: HRDC domain-containing protein [Desulfuromonadales bacterium]|nr:HRDC domain-containing protein [Desulfuromonadales bacterium]